MMCGRGLFLGTVSSLITVVLGKRGHATCKMCGRGLVLRTISSLITVVWGKRGHATCNMLSVKFH